MLKLYENIKERRLALGMTQQQLADSVGYDSGKSMIAKIEAGRVDLTQSKICEFATALKTTPSDLMGDVDCNEVVLTNEEMEIVKSYRESDREKRDLIKRLLAYSELIRR